MWCVRLSVYSFHSLEVAFQIIVPFSSAWRRVGPADSYLKHRGRVIIDGIEIVKQMYDPSMKLSNSPFVR